MMFKVTVITDLDVRRYILKNGLQIVIATRSPFSNKDFFSTIVFIPFGTISELIFTNSYEIFVSTNNLTYWNPIKINASTDSLAGRNYFFNNLRFGNSSLGFNKSLIGITNKRKIQNMENSTCGVLQKVLFNGEPQLKIINIASVPFNQHVYFDISQPFYLFLASNVQENTLIPSSALLPQNKNDFQTSLKPKSMMIGPISSFNQNESISLTFDKEKGKFELERLPLTSESNE